MQLIPPIYLKIYRGRGYGGESGLPYKVAADLE